MSDEKAIQIQLITYYAVTLRYPHPSPFLFFFLNFLYGKSSIVNDWLLLPIIYIQMIGAFKFLKFISTVTLLSRISSYPYPRNLKL